MRKSIILFIAICLLSTANYQLSTAQNDTTLSRVVTVERDFQPVIQSAGKINSRPAIITPDLQLNPVIYSTYSDPLAIGYNVNQLPPAETRFIPQSPLQGVLDGAAGYRNTHLHFGYDIHHKKKMSLALYANHDAYWGVDSYSQSQLGMLVTTHLSGADFYVGIEGNNDFYSYYGRYFDGNHALSCTSISQLRTSDWQTLWQANAKIGIQSTAQSPIQYRIQTGYAAFIATNYMVEHLIQSHLDIAWSNDLHGAGVKAYVQNHMYTSLSDQLPLTHPLSAHHAICLEPFYTLTAKHIRLHAGLNLDMHIGRGEMLSTINNLSFAPSPNVNFEWRMMDDLFHVYTRAKGSFGIGSMEEYLGYNRYLNIVEGLDDHSPRDYTPVDAQLGFKLRPIKTLLLDIYGGYAYIKQGNVMVAHTDTAQSLAVQEYHLAQAEYHTCKVGASLHYHYRDIVELNLRGNYYFHLSDSLPVYDRPNWDAHARVDVHIDSKWSFYSDNHFAGSRLACTTQGDKLLKPTITLNIGGQYAINRWLIAYLQLNNYLNRKHDIFYGYQSQGIHFLAGIKWKF